MTPELERLTYRSESGHAHLCKQRDSIAAIERLCAYEEIGSSIPRLKELAAADAEGRVVVLPCKPGDEVFCIAKYIGEDCFYVKSKNCEVFTIEHDGMGLSVSDPSEWMYETPECIRGFDGKYYLTRAEAEVALRDV